MLGNIYRGLAQYPDAERELKVALAGLDEYGPQYDLGFVLSKEGKPDEALPHAKRAVQLRPDASEAHFLLANILRSLNRTDAANQEMGQVRARSSNRPPKTRLRHPVTMPIECCPREMQNPLRSTIELP